MNIPLFVALINQLIWIFPIFRNWNHQFSYYFLILALIEPIGDIFILTLHYPANSVYIISSFLLLYSIFKFRLLKKNKFLGFGSILIVVGLVSYFNTGQSSISYFLMMLIHIVIFLIILKMFVVDLRNKNSINVFYLVLVLYESILVLKFLLVISFSISSLVFFYISTAFTCLVAVFFILYNEENSPKFKIKLNLEMPD